MAAFSHDNCGIKSGIKYFFRENMLFALLLVDDYKNRLYYSRHLLETNICCVFKG